MWWPPVPLLCALWFPLPLEHRPSSCSTVVAVPCACCGAVQSCMWAELAPVGVSIAACPAAIASSFVAPAASAAAIACCARWAVIAASCASICSFAALLAAAFTAACCRFRSFSAFLSSRFCSSCSIQGRVLCPLMCSVRSRACFRLSGSRRFRSSRISGVRGIGSLPPFPLELEADDVDPLLRIPEVRSSLTRSPEFAPYCLRGAKLF